MVRLLLLIESSPHMNGDETQAWLSDELAGLAVRPGVGRVLLTRLENASADLLRGYDWLVELECAGTAEDVRSSCEGALTALYAELRLIGMRPAFALAGDPVHVRADR